MPLEESNSSVNQPVAAPASPVAAPQMSTENKKIRPINISRRGLFFLSAIAVIFLIVIFFVLGFFEEAKKPQLRPSKIGIVESAEKQAVLKDKTYNRYKILFDTLLINYYQSGVTDDRIAVEDVRNRASKLFPQEFKETDFIIPCFDTGCTQIQPEADVAKIIATVSSLKGVPGYLQNVAINDLNAIGYYASDKKLLLAAYNRAFNDLHALYRINKSGQIDESLKQVLALIKQNFPADFAAGNAIGAFKY